MARNRRRGTGHGVTVRMDRDAEALQSQAIEQMQRGRPGQAVPLFQRALALQPGHAVGLYNCAVALLALERNADAAEHLRRAVECQPGLALGHLNLGLALVRLGHADDAEESYRRALAADPALALAWNNLGMLLESRDRLDEAADCLQRSVTLGPADPAAWSNFAHVQQRRGDFAAAEACCRRALALDPVHPPALNNLGNLLKGMGRMAEAAGVLRRAVAVTPTAAKPQEHLGEVLMTLGRWEEAEAALRRALALDPDSLPALLLLRQLQRELCDWREPGLGTRLLAAAEAQPGLVPPFHWLLEADDPALHRRMAAAWCERQFPASAFPRDGFRHAEPRADQRLTIGYLSPYFRDHVCSRVAVGVFEHHDRERFRIRGYSLGADDGSPLRRRLEAAFGGLVELGPLSDLEAARRIHADGVDILVDIAGYMAEGRTGILARRPAPVQVGWCGCPGTMGADFIDYLIADPVIVPLGAEAHYREAIVRMPGWYLPTDDRCPPPPATADRAACGLPAQAVVLCCFNNPGKITPELFAGWMRILATAGDAVLWLLAPAPAVAANLRREAAAQGIDPGRLIFSGYLTEAEYRGRFLAADLFLDTLPYNAHSTAAEALRAGCPVLTQAGAGFAGRVCASLLERLGLPELITNSLEDYCRTASALVRTPSRLAGLRARLAALRGQSPVFDTAGYTRALETAFIGMTNRCDGVSVPFASDL